MTSVPASPDDATTAPPGGGEGAWRILFVDDSADDIELAEIELRHAGLDVRCRRVEREATLIAALAEFAPQLVLSDVNMPGFSGVLAHALVREHLPTARFAFLTGAVDPRVSPLPADVPVVLKDEMGRLPALVRELLGA